MTNTILNTIFFYVLSAIIIIGSLTCLFQKNIANSIIAAGAVFFSISGLYLTLGAAYISCLNIILYAGLITVMTLIFTMTVKKYDKKNAFLFNLKTIAAPILGCFFGILTIPFVLYRFSEFKTLKTYTLIDFSALLFKNNMFAFELTGLLIFSIIVGIAAIMYKKGISNAK